ncbi:hypothetical protein OOK29_06365 [Streptomyces phaeochromogenes]|uniref:hypothetical protein n=1 Tax=Streptomyces phaeochromogenes TaxID=1923 RepID=UPI00224F9883|nr:hypothetical protein [Streptomyces phaeochromogenes]MCX5597761.1 hypothetical protein [Streptomyces phaeochromogenes]
MKDVHEELRATLRDAAEAHEPDRARILARVERGMAGTESARYPSPRSSPLGWFRVVGATAAAAGVLAVGGYAVASAVKDEKAADQTVATSPTPDPSPEATSRAPVPPDPAKSSPPPDRPSTPNSPTAGPTRTAPVAPPAKADNTDGPLWSDGSVDPHSNEFWAQSNVTLKTSKQLTALTVVLKVKQTGGVTSAGAWRSAPEDDFTVTVAEKDGFLVYTWVLKSGRTVWPGEWVFAGQYDHDRGGRDAGDDTYAVGAQAGGQQLGVAGDFARDASDDDGDS